MNLDDFKCLGCKNCCKQDGYVRLTADEPDAIADFLNMSSRKFIEKYTILTRDRKALSLIDKDNGECIFLQAHGCAIQPVKPAQCIDFPHKWKFKAFMHICAWAKKNLKDTAESEA
jgi:Fe-S-cluster containining protein